VTRRSTAAQRLAPAAPLAVWAVVWLLGSAASALTLEFPGPATLTATPATTRASYAMPTGRWADGNLPVQVIDGMVERSVWQVEAPNLSSLDLIQPLRAQLVAAGFTPVFECETMGCGGFDFRFATDVLPEPQMHVDLGDFRFLSAERGAAGREVVGLMVSRSASKGFVQMTRAVADDGPALFAATNNVPGGFTALTPPKTDAANPGSAMSHLLTEGAVVLNGLDFGTGAADLTEGRYESLAALADWLLQNPDKTVALVGHTDASGGLDSNIVISKRRAASVRARLIEAYGIPPAQIEAQGVGYLAPLATNLTEEGRQKNRRVEAILTSTQ
jgi:outer membrane protein OmpA-like peptidoglycan-associated protein